MGIGGTKLRPGVLLIFLFMFLGLVMLLILSGVPIKYALAVAYVPLFVILSWNKPDITVMLIFALAPFQQNIGGGAVAKFGISELSLAMAVPVFLFSGAFRKRIGTLGPLVVPITLYLVVCVFSIFLNLRGATAFISIAQMLLYIYCAIVFSSLVQKRENINFAFNGFIIVCLLLSFFALIQRSNYILGLHKNGLGDSLAAGAIICAELYWAATDKKYKNRLLFLLTIILLGLLSTLSRGSWLGALFGISLIMSLRKKFKYLFFMGMVLIPLFLIFWHFLPSESKDYVGDFSSESWNIDARFKSIDIAKEEFLKNPILGMGVGLRKEYDATNVLMSVLAETGILGLISFIFIHLSFYGAVWKTQKKLDGTHYLYSVLAIGAALHTNRLAHSMVDHYWQRGASLIAWAGTGMAIGVYFLCRDMNRREEA